MIGLALALTAAAAPAADEFSVSTSTQVFLPLTRVVQFTHCDAPADVPRVTRDGQRLFADVDCSRLEWTGAFIGMGQTVATTLRDRAQPDAGFGESVVEGDRICREGRRVLHVNYPAAPLERWLLLEGTGNNCWRERNLPPKPWPRHWGRCRKTVTAGASPAAHGRDQAQGTDCAQLALYVIVNSTTRHGGRETSRRSASVMRRDGRHWEVEEGDRVCGLRVLEVGETSVVTEPAADGRNCFHSDPLTTAPAGR
jgi:hypothetical protein